MKDQFTQILIDARARQLDARQEDPFVGPLMEALYPELRRLAVALMRQERRGHTLQPTALVSEAFLRLVDQTRVDVTDRSHFLGIAARVMRQVLIDHARRHAAAKRGAGAERITLGDGVGASAGEPIDVLILDEALDRLAAIDPRGARVVEMRVFGGMTIEEIALVLKVSKRTVNNDWAVARMWLARELGPESDPRPRPGEDR